MKFIIATLLLFLFSCQTVDVAKIESRILAVEQQVVFEWYQRMIHLCLIQNELCRLKEMGDCQAKTDKCGYAIDKRFMYIKKKRGWK